LECDAQISRFVLFSLGGLCCCASRPHTDSLHFEGWTIGDSITKNIVLKNLLFTAVRVTPSVPKTESFTLKTKPQTVLVSAGTTLSIPVVFRAKEASDLDDVLEISTPEGIVKVALQARLPRPALTLPAQLTCPVTAVGATHTQKFILANDTAQSVVWMLSTDGCFTVSPTGGQLAPRETASITLTFKPTDARTHAAAIRVKMDGGLAGVAPLVQAIAVSGQAAFAHVLVDGAEATAVPG
jgi:hypothetical protein